MKYQSIQEKLDKFDEDELQQLENNISTAKTMFESRRKIIEEHKREVSYMKRIKILRKFYEILDTRYKYEMYCYSTGDCGGRQTNIGHKGSWPESANRFEKWPCWDFKCQIPARFRKNDANFQKWPSRNCTNNMLNRLFTQQNVQ